MLCAKSFHAPMSMFAYYSSLHIRLLIFPVLLSTGLYYLSPPATLVFSHPHCGVVMADTDTDTDTDTGTDTYADTRADCCYLLGAEQESFRSLPPAEELFGSIKRGGGGGGGEGDAAFSHMPHIGFVSGLQFSPFHRYDVIVS